MATRLTRALGRSEANWRDSHLFTVYVEADEFTHPRKIDYGGDSPSPFERHTIAVNGPQVVARRQNSVGPLTEDARGACGSIAVIIHN